MSRPLAIVPIALALFTRISAAQDMATISGRVTDERREPVSAVQVFIGDWNVRAITAADGRYRLAVPGGRLRSAQTVTITASRAGFERNDDTLTVSAGASLIHDFRLVRSAPPPVSAPPGETPPVRPPRRPTEPRDGGRTPRTGQPGGGVAVVYTYDAGPTLANYCARTSLTAEQCRIEFGVRHPGSYTMTLYPDGTGYVAPATPSTRTGFWSMAAFIWESVGANEIRTRSMAAVWVVNRGVMQRSGLEVVYTRDGNLLRPRRVRLLAVQQIDYIIAPDGSRKPGTTVLGECGRDARGTRVVVYAQAQPGLLADYAVFRHAPTVSGTRPPTSLTVEQAAAVTAAFDVPTRLCEGDGDVAR